MMMMMPASIRLHTIETEIQRTPNFRWIRPNMPATTQAQIQTASKHCSLADDVWVDHGCSMLLLLLMLVLVLLLPQTLLWLDEECRFHHQNCPPQVFVVVVA